MRASRITHPAFASLLAALAASSVLAFAAFADVPRTASSPSAASVDTLRYVDRVQIGQPPCPGCAPVVCANRPFVVTLSGTLPDNCTTFNGLSLVPVVNVREGPPIVRAKFGVNDCLGMPCVDQPQAWTASIELPALPAGGNGLTVESMVVSWCDSNAVRSLQQAAFPMMVQDTCPPPNVGCLNFDWGPFPPPGTCNANFINDTASVNLRIASPRSLAGLQGLLKVEPGLEVRGLHPIGPASGMTLEWRRTSQGAAFVMFATEGAPIPPFATVGDDTAYNFAPVLHVEVQAVPYITTFRDPPKKIFAMYADSLLGADSLGQGVPMCLMRCLDTDNNRCGMPVARFCLESGCDVNFDGHTDVRDLVRLVYCLHSRGCFPPVAFDCNGDSLFTILDVLCCAREMLHGYEGPGAGGRPDPAIGLSFAEPVRAGDELELPFTLAGADRVGAARMVLRFPSSRYDVESFGLVGNPPGWLALSEVAGDQVVVALIATDASQAGTSLPLSLRLRLRPGAEHGGEVIAREADVSSADGVALQTSIEGTGAVVDPGAAIALSAVHPNPGAGPMRFTLTLPRGSDVDLAIYDPAGRRVASVHRGALAPGVHPFTWDGRTDRGESARDGIYFVRLRAGGTELARKAVLVRGH